jgi:hypothetical protein
MINDVIWPETDERTLARCKLMLRIIAEAADRGERCPTADQFCYLGVPGPVAISSRLADAGIIRIEVSAHNWRTVWICQGEHRGKHTMLRKTPSKPYIVRGPAKPNASVSA